MKECTVLWPRTMAPLPGALINFFPQSFLKQALVYTKMITSIASLFYCQNDATRLMILSAERFDTIHDSC